METEKISYLVGRLVGLNELVSILKDIVQKGNSTSGTDIAKTMIIRISSEMTQIINELKVEKGINEETLGTNDENETEKEERPVERPAAKKKAADKDKSSSNADDLMQELVNFKGK